MQNFTMTVFQDEKNPNAIVKTTTSSVNNNSVFGNKIIQYSDLTVEQKAIYDSFKDMIITITLQ